MKTQLYEWHKKNGSIVEFAGFQMPVSYSSITEEHMSVRNEVGVFDVSHMGRMSISGADAEIFLNSVLARDISKVKIGRAAYTMILNPDGGVRDDVVIFRLEERNFMMVWNAGNLYKIWNWVMDLSRVISSFKGLDLKLKNQSTTCSMFALQGPKSREILSQVVSELPGSWQVNTSEILGTKCLISGSGYTGETGFEVIIPETTLEDPSKALGVWEKLIELGAVPCGLGARDTLRLEAGYHLYGQDLTEVISPLEAGLCFPPLVHLEKETRFIGQGALKEKVASGENQKRVGLIAEKRGPSPRVGSPLFIEEDTQIGICTSGTFSPLLKVGIGMAFVDKGYHSPETKVLFEVRGKKIPAKISKFPLYDPKRYGAKREEN